MTIFNWGDSDFSDWSAAVQLKNAASFQKAYSFNSTVWTGHNGTILLQGLPSFNYLLAEKDGKNPKKDFRVPGSQQSVIMFTKQGIPGLNVVKGDMFPTRVWFNGEECSLPDIIPSKASTTGIRKFMAAANSFLVFTLLVFLQ
ncbi:hypothetical protein MLD38_012355 [Melastoma candidum]|uniref:Uncharacterized protein n=1 Tax=Melastoma candidum TaxID=119954 RepID=A0ACB9R746_9MYRT|nr:hypothetical protein MLD38_012355 [Melastoma candidum]